MDKEIQEIWANVRDEFTHKRKRKRVFRVLRKVLLVLGVLGAILIWWFNYA